jgi:2'-5' RNA ligase
VNRAIVLHPRISLDGIDAIRMRLDPLAHAIAPHITLVFPFESDLLSKDIESHVRSALVDHPPFDIRLDGITGDDAGYIFLNVTTGRDELIRLHDALYLGQLAPHLSLEHVYRPHLTLGRVQEPKALTIALAAVARSAPTVEPCPWNLAVHQLRGSGAGFTEFVIPFHG